MRPYSFYSLSLPLLFIKIDFSYWNQSWSIFRWLLHTQRPHQNLVLFDHARLRQASELRGLCSRTRVSSVLVGKLIDYLSTINLFNFYTPTLDFLLLVPGSLRNSSVSTVHKNLWQKLLIAGRKLSGLSHILLHSKSNTPQLPENGFPPNKNGDGYYNGARYGPENPEFTTSRRKASSHREEPWDNRYRGKNHCNIRKLCKASREFITGLSFLNWCRMLISLGENVKHLHHVRSQAQNFPPPINFPIVGRRVLACISSWLDQSQSCHVTRDFFHKSFKLKSRIYEVSKNTLFPWEAQVLKPTRPVNVHSWTMRNRSQCRRSKHVQISMT